MPGEGGLGAGNNNASLSTNGASSGMPPEQAFRDADGGVPQEHSSPSGRAVPVDLKQLGGAPAAPSNASQGHDVSDTAGGTPRTHGSRSGHTVPVDLQQLGTAQTSAVECCGCGRIVRERRFLFQSLWARRLTEVALSAPANDLSLNAFRAAAAKHKKGKGSLKRSFRSLSRVIKHSCVILLFLR